MHSGSRHDTHGGRAESSPSPDDQRLTLASGLRSLEASEDFGGVVEPLDDHPHCNEHLVHVYETREEQFAVLAPYIRQGLEDGERVMYVVCENTREAVAEQLRANGVDVDAAMAAGQLSFHDVDETYLRDGSFDPDGMIEFYAATIEEATQEWAALRVAAETGWVAHETTDIESWMDYESRVNEVFEGADCIALCQYDRTRLPSGLIRDLVQSHPHLVYEETVCHNFYYTPPAEFSGPDQPNREVDHMLRTLVERTQAKSDLHEQRRYLHRQTEITADPDRSFEEKLEALFGLGCERFDADLGAVARVDPHRDAFEIEAAGGDHDGFEEGTTLPLSETYCTAAVDAGGPAGVTDPEASGHGDITVRRELGVEAYAGTYVEIPDGVDRTFFFVSADPREEPYSRDDLTFLQLLGQWIEYELQQRSTEERLRALNDLNRALMDAGSVESVAQCVVDAADGLALPATVVGLYDASTGRLERTAATERAASIDGDDPLAVGDGVGWNAFLTGERRHEPRRSSDLPAPLTDVVAVPLGDHGVLVTCLPGDGDPPATELDFVETVAGNATGALDRAQRERELETRESTLAERNETLTRLDRINTIIRGIDGGLVSAASRPEIESVVCEHLVDAGPYEFAWVGTHDPIEGGVVPEEWAGADPDAGETVPCVAAGDCGDTLAERAYDSRDIAVANDLLTDPSAAAWREEALNRGYHAAVALPLVYDDTRFGVLTVFADQPGVFDELERAVLAELGDNIAHAIDAVEHKRSLASDVVTELRFELPGDVGVAALSDARSCGVVHDGLVPQADGSYRWYFHTRGADPAAVLDAPDHLPASDVRLLADRDDDSDRVALFEATPEADCPPRDLLERGASIRELRADGGTASLTVDLAAGTNVREFVDTLRTKYGEVELVGKRDRERSLHTAEEGRAVLTEALTDRQFEVLRTAYFSGYFEQPRARTGSEIAASLGVSQPTFAAHLRNAQARIYAELLEDGP